MHRWWYKWAANPDINSTPPLTMSNHCDRNNIIQPQCSVRAWTDYVYKGKMKSRDIQRKADAPLYS
jgi:hypothetical protein